MFDKVAHSSEANKSILFKKIYLWYEHLFKRHKFLKILIVNGPNLNLLGTREPDVYGSITFEDYFNQLKEEFTDVDLFYFQSNIEGELIDQLQQFKGDGIILNAGGYSHTSVAIADAVSAIETPVVAVHISNIYAREPERHHDLISKYAKGGIFGLGLEGYRFAIKSFLKP